MATVDETYKLALENRNALNLIKDKAKKTSDFPLVTALDTDLVRVTRGGVSSHTPVSDIRALSGAGEDNVQANWDEANGSLDAYIMNKPINLSDFVNDIGAGESGGDIPESNLSTGVISGGLVTINAGDPTKFDVAAGEGVIIDWVDPDNPTKTYVSWIAKTAVAIPNYLLGFSLPYILFDGSIVVVSGQGESAVSRRSRIQLQSLLHAAGATITGVGTSTRPAYEVTQSILDYILKNGILNEGNLIINNGIDLQVDKTSGASTYPFLNRANNPQDPTTKTIPLASPLTGIVRSYRNGIGGHTLVPGVSVIDPNFYDDGSGILAAVAVNKYTIQRYYYFPQNGTSAILYGQIEYNSLAEAVADVFLESPELNPITSLGSYTTAIIVKAGTTNLSIVTDAQFVNVDIHGGGGGTSGATGDMLKSIYDLNDNGIVDNSELLNGLPSTDFVLDADHHLTHEGQMQFFKGIGNLLKTLEAGDWVKGIWNATEFWEAALYNGGDDTLKASYTIYNYYEY